MRTLFLAAFVLTCSAYVGSYAALVRPGLFDSPRYAGQVEERYPCAERAGRRAETACRSVYAPANWLDRKLRPRAWDPPACIW